jgi:hypothetical protein
MRRRLVVRVLLVGCAALVAFELAVRTLLFADFASGWAVTGELREPARYAHPLVDDLYWELQHELADRAQRVATPGYDARMGWVGSRLQSGDLRHVDAASVGARRPVLLFGDSYSACQVAPGGCFEDALERHALGRTHRLLNHGVGGYGLDQAALLLDATVDAFAARDPVVIFGVLVDSDLDRCALAVRGWRKPRIERVGGEWSLEPEPVPADARIAAPWATSYGLRLLLHGTNLLPRTVHDALCDEAERTEANRARCHAILASVAAGLERRGLESFFLLFHRIGSLEDPSAAGWREPFLVAELDALGVPWASTRGPLRAHAAASGRALTDYYQENGHLNALGNEAAFGAIIEGLGRRFGDGLDPGWTEAELRGALAPDRIAEVVLGGPKAAARYEYGSRPPFESAADRSRLCFRAATQGPTDLSYELAGRARAFEASARLMPVGALGPGEGSVGLTVLVDGRERARYLIRRGDDPLPFAIDTTGAERLTLRVDDAGDGIRGDWLVLTNPSFRGDG